MHELIIDAILEASEAELREAWGDEEYEQLAREGHAAVEAALASVPPPNTPQS